MFKRNRNVFAMLMSVLVLNALGGCVPVATGTFEGIGFREARFREISEMQNYRACVTDALKLSDRARLSGQIGSYRGSARLLSRCEADLGPAANSLAREERMRNYGLSVVNFLKAGDIDKARNNLEAFKTSFDGHDLYLPGGASFIDTMTLLTKESNEASMAEMAMMNVPATLRSEIQRIRFWKNN